MKLRKGMIVKTLGYRRYWIVLPVTKIQHKAGVNCPKQGLHLFSGYWYSELTTTYKDIKCYGKINSCNQPLKIVGYVNNSFLIRKLMR